MKYLWKIFISSLILLIATNHIYSQSRFGVHFGPAFPLSNFGLYVVNDYSSDPIIGINVGGAYLYRFSDKGLGVFAAVDFIYNGISKEYKEEVERWPDLLRGDPPVYHEFYNIPFSTGVNYNFRLHDELVLSSNAGLTVNCLLISDSDLGLYKSSSDPAFSLGGRIGVGLILKERLSINFDYLGLGSHSVSCETIRGLSQTKEEYDVDLDVHMLTLSAGVYF